MIKLILFDIDGTLIRSAGAGSMAFGRAFDTLFNLPDGAQSLDFAGRTDRSLLQEFFQNHGIDGTPDLEEAFFDIYSHWLGELLPQVEGAALPGVRDLLDTLIDMDEAPHLGLLTGNARLAAEIKLRHFDLWKGFKIGSFGDDHHCRNELARKAMLRSRAMLDPSLEEAEILVIGDTPRDVACAHSIGAKSLAVATGSFNQSALEEAGASHTVQTLADIAPDALMCL